MVVTTDPATQGVTLAQRERFYVLVELNNAGSVALEPYAKGMPVIDGIAVSAAATFPAGGGRSVVSFFYWGDRPAAVDELRLNVTTPAGVTTAYSLPVQLTLSTQNAGTPRPRADWVTLWETQHVLPAAAGSGLSAQDKTRLAIIAGILIVVSWTALFFIVRSAKRKKS